MSNALEGRHSWHVYPAFAVTAVPIFRGSAMQVCADAMRDLKGIDTEPQPIEEGIHRLGPYFIVSAAYARQKGWRC